MAIIRFVICLLVFFVAVASAQPQSQGQYPVKFIRLIVPFAAGGGTDILGRLLASGLTAELGQSVMVENVSGAGGTIGANAVANASADGYTLLVSTASTFGLAVDKLSYDPLKSIEPVGLFATSSNIIVVHPSLPVKSVKEFIDYIKQNPGKVLYGTGGLGTTIDMGAILFNRLAKVDLVRVAYRGTGPAMIDLLAGRLHVMFDNVNSAAEYVRSGQLRALAVTAGTRQKSFPDLPTVAEAGLPDYLLEVWWGVHAPRGTPPAVVERLAKAIEVVTKTQSFRDALDAQGVAAQFADPREFDAFFRKDFEQSKSLMGPSETK